MVKVYLVAGRYCYDDLAGVFSTWEKALQFVMSDPGQFPTGERTRDILTADVYISEVDLDVPLREQV